MSPPPMSPASPKFGFFTQESPQVLPPTSPLKGRGKPKDDRNYETPQKENIEPQKKTSKRPPLTPAGAPAPKLSHVQVPSIEKQINQQLADSMRQEDASGRYSGGHMNYGESPFMFMLADVFITSRTKTHRLAWCDRGGKSGSPDSQATQPFPSEDEEEEVVDEGTLKQWLIEESESNARILKKLGTPTPKKKKQPENGGGKKLKLPKGGKAKVDNIVKKIREAVTTQFATNPRLMEMSADEIANRLAAVAMEVSTEAAARPSAVNHARSIAKKKNPQDI
ncbi:hypothetical protein SEMRO_189_G081450.1 [Seminavis robusta]|uniref:Uncharacterized protein n=1 Tax=Seminavis robusta TaxID=568900 RepID=A0A9N8DJL8_9STRA|nr:hypothetical protein SEMRO_189_G081450.1 [Seminavis robusta]|eukprot:Sro189_g081450.1 n/a (280) ;mRNA; f:30449-31288